MRNPSGKPTMSTSVWRVRQYVTSGSPRGSASMTVRNRILRDYTNENAVCDKHRASSAYFSLSINNKNGNISIRLSRTIINISGSTFAQKPRAATHKHRFMEVLRARSETQI